MKYLFKGNLSIYCGAVIADLIDVHTYEDVQYVEKVMKKNILHEKTIQNNKA